MSVSVNVQLKETSVNTRGVNESYHKAAKVLPYSNVKNCKGDTYAYLFFSKNAQVII